MTTSGKFKRAFQPTQIYVITFVVFIGHQIGQKFFGLSIPVVDSYLDPFLSIPLLLGIAAAERNWLFGEEHWEGFKPIELIAMTLALAILFEEGFPRLDPVGQTRDGFDYLAYAGGAAVYYFNGNYARNA